MRKLIHSAMLISFIIGLFASLWMLSSCGETGLSHLQPFAAFHDTCSNLMASEHISLWRNLLLTFIFSVATAAIASAVLVVIAHIQRQTKSKQLHATGRVLQPIERWPRMKPWDPLLVALAQGTVQHGSRNQ